jgi:hypothetical protein
MPARSFGFTCGGAAFFGVDTSGCQFAVQRSDISSRARLAQDIDDLASALAAANPAMPKIVFGHHTLYTKGRGHGAEAKCLRLSSYTYRERYGDELKSAPGFGMEGVLAAGGAAAYFHGHEHVLQAHPSPTSGVPSFCIGASAYHGFYGGENVSAEDAEHWPAWVNRTEVSGFAQVDVWSDKLVVTFVGCSDLGADPLPAVLRVDTVPLPPPACPRTEVVSTAAT